MMPGSNLFAAGAVLTAVMLLPLNAAARGLSAGKARKEAERLRTEWLRDVRTGYESSWQGKRLETGGRTMPFDYIKYGP